MRDARPLDPEDLPGLGIHEPVPVYRGGWPVVGDVWLRIGTVPGRPLVEVFMSHARVLEAMPEEDVPLEQDPLLPLAETFRDGCLLLQAEAAWLDTAAHFGDPAWRDRHGSTARNRELAELGLAADVGALLGERLALLWLDEYLLSLFDGDLGDRDVLPTPGGLVVFGHSGDRRWLS